MYSIAAAADLTGLDEDTIRDWEGTYGLFAPRRAESGHRGYHDNDLRALGAMASLLDVGWGPAEAAAEANGRARRGPVAPPPREPVLARPRDDLTVTFMSAAADLDVATLGEVLDAAWECHGADLVADDWLLPAVSHLDGASAAGELGAAGMHLALDLARGRLLTEYDDALRAVAPGAPRALIGVALGVVQDLGMLAFAGLLARAGTGSAFLGGRLRDADWVGAVRTCRTRHVVLAVPRPQDLLPTTRLAERLIAALPRLVVHVGGRYQHLITPPLRTLGHHVGTAADSLALTLACDPADPADPVVPVVPVDQVEPVSALGVDVLAEADRNRTCQTEMLGLTGVEDRGAHQEPRRLHRAG